MNINLGANASIKSSLLSGKNQNMDKSDIAAKDQDKSFKNVLGQKKSKPQEPEKISTKRSKPDKELKNKNSDNQRPDVYNTEDRVESRKDNYKSSNNSDSASANRKEVESKQISSQESRSSNRAGGNANSPSVNSQTRFQINERVGTDYNPEGIYDKVSNGFSEKAQIDPLTRRASILNFMQKMKTDLNVSPVKMVEAFSSLSVEELSMPPEITVGKVIEKLDLSMSEKNTALNHFTKMITQTESSSMAEYLTANDKEISLEVLSKQELSEKNMLNNLDKMNNTFFVDNKAKAQQQLINKQNEFLSQSTNTTDISAVNSKESNESKVLKSLGLASGSSQYADKLNLANPGKVTPLNSGMNLDNIVGESLQAGELTSTSKALAFEEQLLGSDKNVLQLKNPNMNNLTPIATASLNTNLLGEEGLELETSMTSGNSSEVVESFKSASNMNMANGEASDGQDAEQNMETAELESYAQEFSNKLNKSGKAIAITKPQATIAEENLNVSEVIKTSQVLIKNGGGEMKVRMTPEGMGEIDLKVEMNGDKVNVEMVASNKESQRILEKGLGDLKAQLASQKINVDQIKVDVSNDTLTDLNQKQDDANKQMAQQFMQEFRNNNQAFKNSFGGYGPREVKSQTEDTAEVQEILAAKSKRQSAGSLDLVA